MVCDKENRPKSPPYKWEVWVKNLFHLCLGVFGTGARPYGNMSTLPFIQCLVACRHFGSTSVDEQPLDPKRNNKQRASCPREYFHSAEYRDRDIR